MLDPIGSQVIDYVYAQMKVSEKWSLRQERGFTWWGHTVAQRVWADPLTPARADTSRAGPGKSA